MEPMDRLSVSRRDFLKAGAGALAVLPLVSRCAKKKIPVGLQLYSVRTECQKDLEKTVEAVAAMGYAGVEFAGYYDRSADQLRRLLDANGLACCGTHIGLDTLLGEAFMKTVEFNRILGNRFLIVPSLPKERQATKQAWLDTAKLFDELAGKAKPFGLRVGYHNHSVEFQPVDGEIPWDLFFGNTSKDVVMQFDTGNAMHGGGRPEVYLRKYPGRAATVHIKEFSATKPDALIGEGDLDWKLLFSLCETVAGTEWYIVEDEDPAAPLERVQKDLVNLKKMGL